MGGIGSGPQKAISTLVREAKENDAKNLPRYFEKLSALALSGDREALFYLISWQIGKPKSTVELEGGEKLGIGVINEIMKLVQTRETYKLNIGETKLLKEADNGSNKGTEEGISTRVYEEGEV